MSVELSPGVRRRIIELAAERLGGLPAERVPASLRSIARFAPPRRARLGATPIAAVLDTDEAFRGEVAEMVREAFPEVVTALEGGTPLPVADPADVAALAYLLRTPNWEQQVAQAGRLEQVERDAQASEATRRASERTQRREKASQAAAGEQLEALRRRVEELQADLDRERGRAREAVDLARRTEAELATERQQRATDRATAERDAAASKAAQRRLTEQVEELGEALTRARRDSRSARDVVDERRWLLLDTLARTVKGLRDELAIPPPSGRPADRVEAGSGGAPATSSAVGDDPRDVDLLLTLPNAHLIVDGYNVTKTGYPDLALSDQRARLVAALSALAARTGAEVTCVFDGAEVVAGVPTTGQRGVRVLFSAGDEIADELIRRLVRAEPVGRPLVVCSADREVIDGVRRAGARTITPTALLARLNRG
ncbi:MAG TPA: NYN domain-containing protein [Mycobacteriales bacterium]|nr:NYN domain-containing protein [Mycobacteriales bacterium]